MPNYQIKNIKISELKPHEQIQPDHLAKLREEIKKDGILKDPIIVDQNTLAILDGHHRYNSLKSLGYNFCPCCLVDYQSDEIGVGCWRGGEVIAKQDVLAAALSGNLLIPKTSRHLIPNRPLSIDIPLSSLY
jgi:hypothetical protein